LDDQALPKDEGYHPSSFMTQLHVVNIDWNNIRGTKLDVCFPSAAARTESCSLIETLAVKPNIQKHIDWENISKIVEVFFPSAAGSSLTKALAAAAKR
jgi:hypothetical protein